MTPNVVTQLSEQYQTFLAPVIKANQQSAANLETLATFQMSALQAYVDIAINRIKAVAEIRDQASLKAFMSSQSETMTRLQQKLVDDAKTLGDLAARFTADFGKLAQESLAVVQEESQSVIQKSQSVVEESVSKLDAKK